MLIIGFIGSTPALADGWTRDGHVSGEHTDLYLSPAQMAELKKNGTYRITVNPSQTAVLVKKFPGAAAVKTLRIYKPQDARCSCEIVDVALRVAPNKIEVADDYLGRSFSHQEYSGLFQTHERLKYPIKPDAPQNALFFSGRKAYFSRSYDTALADLKEAVRYSPKFLAAKYFLSETLINIGDCQKYDQDLDGAKQSYAEAKNVADVTDWRRQDMIAAKIKSVDDLQKMSKQALSALPKSDPCNFDDPGVWKGSSYISESQRLKLFISKVAVLPQTFTAATIKYRVEDAWLEKALRNNYSAGSDYNRKYNFVCFRIKIDARSTSIYGTGRIKLQLLDKNNNGVVKNWYEAYNSNHVYMVPIGSKESEVKLRCLISTTKPGLPEKFVPTDVILRVEIP